MVNKKLELVPTLSEAFELYRHFSAKVDDILGAAPAQPAPVAEE